MLYIYIINLRMFCWYSQEENGDTSVGLDGWGMNVFICMALIDPMLMRMPFAEKEAYE